MHNVSPTGKLHNVSATDFREFVEAYIEAALWSSTDESDESGGEPLDKNYGPDDIADATREKMKGDCIRFLEKVDAANLLDVIDDGASRGSGRYSGWAQAGHDFWLTRNGHGAGFWDGDWPEAAGERLTDISKHFGTYDLMVGDDGQIHGSGG